MTVEQFLDLVEQSGLLDAHDVTAARKQCAAAETRRSAKDVASLLVKRGLLTKNQAQRLLSQASQAEKSGGEEPTSRPAAAADEEKLGVVPDDSDDEEILGLAPLEGDEPPAEKVTMLKSVEPTPAAKRPRVEKTSPQPPTADVGLSPLSFEPPSGPAGLQPLAELGGLEVLGDDGFASLSDHEPLGGGQQPSDVLQQPPRPAATPAAIAIKGSPWDSTLMLAGGGVLLLMVMAIVALYFLIGRGSASQVFQAAEQDYKSQSYVQAVAKYEQFLLQYANDPNASAARVRIATAKLWQIVAGASDKREALKLAGELLPQIELETAFPDIQGELAGILPSIAEGLSDQALKQPDLTKAQELVQAAENAMKLVNTPNYIPPTLHKTIDKKLGTIQENLDKAQRTIQSGQRLNQAVAEIQQAVAAGQTITAYETRRNLIRQYPELEQRPALVEAVQSITAKERELVKVEEHALVAVTEDRPRGSQYQIALASRNGAGLTTNENAVACYLARGSLFGLQAATGRLLWRRFVGHETLASPLPVAAQPGSDLIAVDGRHHELLRLKAATGALVWRLTVGEPFFSPVLNGPRLMVATQSGRILVVDLETGSSAKQVTLPQGILTPPGISKLQRLYQVGDHANLYVLDEDSLACQEVYYLAHKTGTITVPPVMVLGHLFVVENSGEAYCDLHLLAVDAKGLALKPIKKSPLRLSGRVVVPPLVHGGRLIVVTDLGEIHVLEVNSGNAEQPVMEVVEPVPASFKTPRTGYAVFDNGRLWVGNDRLTKYELQALKNKLLVKWSKAERDTFVGPSQVQGDLVLSIRRRQRSPAYAVAALHVDDGRLLWETDLATPLTLVTGDVTRKQIYAVSAQAELFEIAVTQEALQAGRLDQPIAAAVGAARTVAFPTAIGLDGGVWALTSGQDRSQLVIFNPQAPANGGRLDARKIRAAGEAQIAGPVWPFGGGLLVPLDNGQLAVIDPLTGENKSLPFQSPIEAGSKVTWCGAAVVGTERQAFVIADSRKQLFRVGIKPGSSLHLEQLAQNQLDVEIVSPLAACGEAVLGVVRGPQQDKIVVFAVKDLSAGQDFPIEGRVLWGPEAVGDVVLAATDRQQLLCFEAGPKQRWAIKLAYGPLAGPPRLQEHDLMLASQSGMVWRIALADGSETGKTDIGEPLSAGPVPFASRLLVPGSDGTLHVIPALTAPEGKPN